MHPTMVSRRWFFEQCGIGLGTMALGQLLSNAGFAAPADVAATHPLAPEEAAFYAESQECDFPLYGRRSQPFGAVRQQTTTGKV